MRLAGFGPTDQNRIALPIQRVAQGWTAFLVFGFALWQRSFRLLLGTEYSKVEASGAAEPVSWSGASGQKPIMWVFKMLIDSDKMEIEELAVSPFREMGAYEALWSNPKTTFKSLSQKFAQHPGRLPSCFVDRKKAQECAEFVKQRFEDAKIGRFGVRVYGAGEYPKRLRDAAYPIELLYYQGWWDLANSRSIAVVGARNPSREGLVRTRRLTRALVADDFTVVSGLAIGVDRMAHETAVEENGRTIAVIGTPLSHVYPKENEALQRHIAQHFLLISQVPVKRYESQDFRLNRNFFPDRNITMSALTEATVIVEAGERSGTLVQARAALQQRRKLFILDNCFCNPQLTWPARFAGKGAIRVKDYNDLRQHLFATSC